MEREGASCLMVRVFIGGCVGFRCVHAKHDSRLKQRVLGTMEVAFKQLLQFQWISCSAIPKDVSG